MTVNEIIVLSMCYVNIPLPEGQWVVNSIESLAAKKLIHNDCTMTEKGNVLVQMLKDTPMPKRQFVDPRN